jgi:hypothetical protein
MRKAAAKLSICFITVLLCCQARSESSKILGIEVAAGAPQVLSVQLVYWGLGTVAVGIGFGSAPVNSLIQPSVPTTTIALSLGLPDSYSLIPSSSFSLTTTSAFLRYKPTGATGSGFISELNFARWGFGAAVNGTLLNQTTGDRTSGVATGSLDLSQPVLSAMVGYQVALADSLTVLFSGGVGYLFPTAYTTTISGSITTALPLAGAAAQADFESAKSNLNQQIRTGIDTVRSRVRWIPALSITLGYVF